MKGVILSAFTIVLVGCVPKPPEDKRSIGGFVDIYSTTSTAIAQDRADKLCGGHAYFVINEHTLPKIVVTGTPGIRFNCDIDMAAHQGSKEAKDILMKRLEEAYKDMYKAKYEQKEARRRSADPKKLESYTERDPDGTIRSYSFLNGRSCESIVYPDGTGTTTCD